MKDTQVTYLRQAAGALVAQARRPSYTSDQRRTMLVKAGFLSAAAATLLTMPERRSLRNRSGRRDKLSVVKAA